MKQLIIKLETIFAQPISRSQAREVLKEAGAFEALVIDYEHIALVGQAFADEVYRVFQRAHPVITIENQNMGKEARFMVQRAINEAKK